MPSSSGIKSGIAASRATPKRYLSNEAETSGITPKGRPSVADMSEESRAPYDPMPHGPPEVGVGPWEGPWPEGEQYDARLLAEGDRRNVVDRYRYWRHEAIVADLDHRRHDFHVAIENWQHDLNIGSVVRNANSFLAAEVHIVGLRRWNRRGAMVTDRYQHIRHHATLEAFAGGAGACRPGGASPRPPCSRSASSARPARSTRPPRRRSRCTSGSGATRGDEQRLSALRHHALVVAEHRAR